MKNKVFTYFLGVAVVLIWGLIIYKVIKATSNDDEPLSVASRPLETEPMAEYVIPKDTVHLSLNYRDPFIEKKEEPVELHADRSISENKAPPKSKPVINWSVIKYSGFIHNQGSKKLVAMVNINGKSLMMTEGETAEQVKLLKSAKDSIKVFYQGATKFIVLSKL